MQISGNFSLSGVDATRAASRSNAPTEVSASPNAPAGISAPVDQLDLSPEALSIGQSASAGEVFRADKVASLREAIAAGGYDTDEKLSAALDTLLEKLG